MEDKIHTSECLEVRRSKGNRLTSPVTRIVNGISISTPVDEFERTTLQMWLFAQLSTCQFHSQGIFLSFTAERDIKFFLLNQERVDLSDPI
jgi:hypothetical protein